MASWRAQSWLAVVVLLLGSACGGAVRGTLTAPPPERPALAESHFVTVSVGIWLMERRSSDE